ncbi:HD domain-containing protein [Pseudomonas cavernae]|uniref:HD domain-containing protein n=1 Tax=Pseudomonas cavernae TaxID=2320867 RepID=A0A385YYQ6_9PSED|nr:phosphonate degradation HD-domain oxygenase [Pseudomonas cavernae]AYC31087.1 HD domain-containing protein [Pseudomonas cavernae]
MSSAEPRLAELFALYAQHGSADYIGEPVSQLEHMSQAAQLALAEGADDELVLAAFFHDLGHLCGLRTAANDMGGYGVRSHEKLGADYLRALGFGERLARLVENHVQAKRYLCFKEPAYFARLSEASICTLGYQGGVMSADEAAAFERDPLFAASLRLRGWDEQAKLTGVPPLDLAALQAMALRLLKRS